MAAPIGEVGTCAECNGELPYGHAPACPYARSAADASDTMTGIAAPLLAGFTITLIGVIAQASNQFRWPGLSLMLLTTASVLLITTIQAGFWSRKSRPQPNGSVTASGQVLSRSYTRWSNTGRYTYNAGIFALLLGLAASLAPPHSADTLRWVAAAISAVAAIIEVVWICYAAGRTSKLKRGR